MFLAIMAVVGVLISAWQAWQWVSGDVARVRTAVRSAEPTLECTVGSYGGAGSGLTAPIHNSGSVRAHDLALTVPTMGVVWQQTFLAGGDWAKPQMPIAENASLRTTKLTDPVATLTYEDDFQHVYTLTLPLTQTPGDDGRFNFGSLPGKARVDRPAFTALRLWRLRKKV